MGVAGTGADGDAPGALTGEGGACLGEVLGLEELLLGLREEGGVVSVVGGISKCASRGASRDRNGWVGTRARRGEDTGSEGRGARTGRAVNAPDAYLDLLGGELELPDVARGEVPPGTLVVELHLAPAGCDANALGERGGARPARPAGCLDAHRDRARPFGEWAVRCESCGPPRDAREGVRSRTRAHVASWLASCDGCASKRGTLHQCFADT